MVWRENEIQEAGWLIQDHTTKQRPVKQNSSLVSCPLLLTLLDALKYLHLSDWAHNMCSSNRLLWLVRPIFDTWDNLIHFFPFLRSLRLKILWNPNQELAGNPRLLIHSHTCDALSVLYMPDFTHNKGEHACKFCNLGSCSSFGWSKQHHFEWRGM